ncbi:hypothetical protein [Sphingopyxis panaciterrulae]|uniref:Homogentisate 1,2-dioxygenase n=1 Tax=Sphingopyxis panaciterrulae TaxID=462372 RepID=A0A7W9B6Y1_9SPHN|nr:hypothetical protein [Sphingopyxis panaciterrulae]MBB5707152.1 hypothetical protein [Sphingopyxis panaciterrulae]
MSLSATLLAALLAVSAEPAVCSAPTDLSATPLAAWTATDGDANAAVAPGQPVTLTMTDGAAARTLTVDAAGRYGVAADGRVWIDLTANGEPLTSVEHGHGPACSGIRKIVWFDLTPGTYELALSKAAADRVRVLVLQER